MIRENQIRNKKNLITKFNMIKFLALNIQMVPFSLVPINFDFEILPIFSLSNHITQIELMSYVQRDAYEQNLDIT